jgi:hypothetical protein
MSTLESMEGGHSDYRIVWEVVYAYTHYHRVDDGCGDSRHSHTSREQRIIHIIAPTIALCRAAFDQKYPARCDYEFVHCNPLCTINHEITCP